MQTHLVIADRGPLDRALAGVRLAVLDCTVVVVRVAWIVRVETAARPHHRRAIVLVGVSGVGAVGPVCIADADVDVDRFGRPTTPRVHEQTDYEQHEHTDHFAEIHPSLYFHPDESG